MKTTRSKSPWKVGRRAFLGIDAWTGRAGQTVSGFCAVYEVSESNQSTGEFRTRVERGHAIYAHEVSPDVADILGAYVVFTDALRSHAHKADARHFPTGIPE